MTEERHSITPIKVYGTQETLTVTSWLYIVVSLYQWSTQEGMCILKMETGVAVTSQVCFKPGLF